MKKSISESNPDDDLRPEYDFRGAARGRRYKPLHAGYSVHIRRQDGTTEVRQYVLTKGTVLLQPDVREYFPDSDAVNSALRSLIVLMKNVPNKIATRKRIKQRAIRERQNPIR